MFCNNVDCKSDLILLLLKGTGCLGGDKMTEYQAIYLRLFNRVTDIIELLQKVQQEAEESFTAAAEETSTKCTSSNS